MWLEFFANTSTMTSIFDQLKKPTVIGRTLDFYLNTQGCPGFRSRRRQTSFLLRGVVLAIAGVNHSIKMVLPPHGRQTVGWDQQSWPLTPQHANRTGYDKLTYCQEFSSSQWWKRWICRRRGVATVGNFRALGHSTRRWAPRN